MDRQQMIDDMEWLAPGSGTGFGICRVGNMMAWAVAKVPEGYPDLKSVVAIRGEPEDYTDDEIEALWQFSKRRTAFYDRMFTQRIGANMIIIGKIGKDVLGDRVSWLRKRLSWDMGNWYSNTLEEALEVFNDDIAIIERWEAEDEGV